MTITYELKSPEKMQATCTIEAEKVDGPSRAKYQEYVRKVRVPGFRPGHVPPMILKNYFTLEAIREDIAIQALNDESERLLSECPQEAVGFAKDEPVFVTNEAGQDVVVNVTLEVVPKVTVGPYTGLTVKAAKVEVTDAMVDQRIEQERDRLISEEDIEDRPAQEDDVAYIDFEGFKDGVPFEGGKADNQRLLLGSGQMIPGFEDGIVGMQIGEEKDIDVTFPEDYRVEDLKGQPVVFHIKLNHLAKQIVPEIDDDLAADISDYDTLDEYKAHLREELEEDVKSQMKANGLNAIATAIMKESDIPYRESMLNQAMEQAYQEQVMNYRMRGMDLEASIQQSGLNKGLYMQLYLRAQAEMNLKSQLLFQTIVDEQGLMANEEDVKEALKADYQGNEEDWDADKAFADLPSGQLTYWIDRLTYDKLADFLLANNTVEYVDADELEEEEDAEAADETAQPEDAEQTSETTEEA